MYLLSCWYVSIVEDSLITHSIEFIIHYILQLYSELGGDKTGVIILDKRTRIVSIDIIGYTFISTLTRPKDVL